MIDLIQQDYNGDKNAYFNEVLSAQDPIKRLFMDIETIINSATYEELIENTAQVLASSFFAYDEYISAATANIRYYVSHQILLVQRYVLHIKNPPKSGRDVFNVLTENEELQSRIDDCITKKLISLKFEPITEATKQAINKRRLEILEESQANENQVETLEDFARIKNTPAINALSDALKTTQREYKNPGQISFFDNLPGRLIDKWDQPGKDNARKITIQKHDSKRQKLKFVYGIDDYTKLSKFSVEAQKLLLFWREKFLKTEDPNRVIFDIGEFEERVGKDKRNARKMLHNGANFLTNFKYELGDYKGFIVIFPSILVGESETADGQKIGIRGKVVMEKNANIDFSKEGNFTSYIPKYVWKYNGAAWYIATYIYNLLRNDAKNVSEEGESYTKEIKLLYVADVLRLPNYRDTYKIKEWIVDPILKAVNEFNEGEKQNGGAVTLKVKLDKNKPPREALESGKLQIKLNNSQLLEILREIKGKRQEAIEDLKEKQERKEARIDAAKGRQLARQEKKDKKGK